MMKRIIFLSVFLFFLFSTTVMAKPVSQDEKNEISKLVKRFFIAYKNFDQEELLLKIMVPPDMPLQDFIGHERWAQGNLWPKKYKICSIQTTTTGYLVKSVFFIKFYSNGDGSCKNKWVKREIEIVKTKNGLRVARFGNDKNNKYRGFWYKDDEMPFFGPLKH